MPYNPREFQESITQELNIIKNRVRQLIGNRHWGEDGRYKEAVLKNVIKRFLPNNLSVGTGFIINGQGQHQVSKQIDIIIYDNTYPILFSEGDFIITSTKNVRGIIEVKSKITTSTLSEIILNLDESVGMLSPTFLQNRTLRLRPHRPSRLQSNFKTFFGIFAFEFEGRIESEGIDNALSNSRGIVNHISLGTEYFIRKWKNVDGRDLVPVIQSENDFYNIYNLNNLSFSYFISNLIDTVSNGQNERHWFAFPIEGTKEVHRVRTVECI